MRHFRQYSFGTVMGFSGSAVSQEGGGGGEPTQETIIAQSSRMTFSFRLLNADYVGNCVRLRRVSDQAESNFGFSGGYLDTAAVESWAAGASLRMVTWFDQSGNGNNATNGTATVQPTFQITSGVAYYLGTGTQYLETVEINVFMTGNPYFCNAVLYPTSTGRNYFMGSLSNIGGTSGNSIIHNGIRSNVRVDHNHWANDSNYSTTITANVLQIHQIEFNNPGSEYTLNGTSLGTRTNPTALDDNAMLTVGRGSAWGTIGSIYEWILHSGATSTLPDDVTTMMNNYYGVF